jgi:hypothetical protein
MKKVSVLSIIAVILLFVSSCSNNNTNTQTDNYTFKSTSYTPTAVAKVSSSLQASDYTRSTLVLGFTSYPTSSGQYKIATGTTPMASDQIAINFADLVGYATYAGAPSGNVYATVTVGSNGKITVSIPTVTLASTTNSSKTGSFSGYLIEP